MSLCLSTCHKSKFYQKERGKRINLVFGMEGSFEESYSMFLENSGIYKNN